MAKYLALALAVFTTIACTNSSDSYMLNGNPISFIMGMQEIKVSFLTSQPNKSIVLTFNKNNDAHLPRLNDLIGFLRDNNSYLARYVLDDYDCKQFAYKLFQDAQARKFKVHFVILAIKGQNVGHAVVAFDTANAGKVFVDFTPMVTADGTQRPSRRIVWVKEGDPYIRIPLESLPNNFVNHRQDFIAFKGRQTTAELELADYNREYDRLDGRKQDLERELSNFEATVKRGVASTDYQRMHQEQERINSNVRDLNGRFDDLKAREEGIRSSFYDFDWVGKDWIIESLKMIP